MKKIIAIALALVLALSLSVSALADEEVTLTIGASPAPHAEILEYAGTLLEDQGIKLDVKIYPDYVQPNLAVDNGDLDANYFQHKPYMDDFNVSNDTHLVSLGAVHYEPLGIYGGKTTSLDELEDGATILIPNDASNGARALLLLQKVGLIGLPEDADPAAVTIYDIEDNPHDYDIKDAEAAQLPEMLQDVDLAVINGNYAIEAGLNETGALAKEDPSESLIEYANILCVKEGREDDPAIQALLEVLQSDEVADFITDTYQGAAVAVKYAVAELEAAEGEDAAEEEAPAEDAEAEEAAE